MHFMAQKPQPTVRTTLNIFQILKQIQITDYEKILLIDAEKVGVQPNLCCISAILHCQFGCPNKNRNGICFPQYLLFNSLFEYSI